MQAAISESRLPDEGEQLYQLISIKEVQPTAEQIAKFGKDEPRWEWHFRGRHTWDDGTPQEVKFWTNTKYGNEKAGLTRLYNNIIPKCDIDKARAADTDSFIGRWWKINVKHVAKQDGMGKKADYLYIQPYVKNGAASKPAPEPEPEPVAAGAVASKGDNPFE